MEMLMKKSKCNITYKWGEWPLDNCMKEAYFGVGFNHYRKDICDYLENSENIDQDLYYFIALIPFILSFMALCINFTFIFICILVIKNKTNRLRKLFTFFLSRSFTIIIAQIMSISCLLNLDTRTQVVLFVVPESLFANANAGICIVLSIFAYTGTIHAKWYNKKITMKKCIILNAIIWISSISVLVAFGIFAFPLLYSKQEMRCYFDNCEKLFAYILAACYVVFYICLLLLIGVYIIIFKKLTKVKAATEKSVKIHSNQNKILMKRLLYNILGFILTKSPFLIVCASMYSAANKIGGTVECEKKFDEAVKFELYLNIALCISIFAFHFTKHFDDEKLLLRKISTGLLRGRKLITPNNVEGFTFLSIPTAAPPIGKLRFKAPFPRKKWNGIFNATEYSVSCFWNSQRTSFVPGEFDMKEDCIFAHVFTNRKCLIEGGCAVVAYIHGGSFHYGTPLEYAPDALVDNFNNISRNIVFVSLAYRQSFLGVPNLNHKLNLSIDLNCGFHDIVHGLKWIKKEIHAFGGNPNRLTVMGDSGGASNIRVLLMSPLTKHLINQAVICSVASDYIFVRDKNENSSRILAKIVGCTNLEANSSQWDNLETVEKIIKCLRLKPAKVLSDAQVIIEAMGYEFKFIARDSGPNAIAPRSYEEMLNETLPIPILSGAVAKEFLHSKNTIIKLPNGTFTINETELHIWSKRALEDLHYLNPKPKTISVTENEYHSIPKSAYIYDDVETFVPTYNYAVNQALRGSNVYLYEYIYQDVGDAYDSGPKKIPRYESPKHAQELSYLLGLHVGNFTEKDIQIKFLYSQMFVDFINHGTPNTPTRKWKKLNPLKSNYFVIDFPDPDLRSPGERNGYHSEAVKFWNTVVPRLEGPKTEIISETQLTYDPYVEKKTVKRNITDSGLGILGGNFTVFFMEIPEADKAFSFNFGTISWTFFVIIAMIASLQFVMFWKLAMKRKSYQKLVN